jgi:hypothetical protein
MTPEQVAGALEARNGVTDTQTDTQALLALAGIATEYLAATDAWYAACRTSGELFTACERLECAEHELRTALGLPASSAQTAPRIAG